MKDMLDARLIRGAYIGLALAFVALAVALSFMSRTWVLDTLMEQATRDAKNVAGVLDDDLRSAIEDLEAMAEFGTIASLDRESVDPVLVGAAASSRMFDSFTVLETSGTVVARPSKPERVGEDRSSRDYFRAVMEEGTTFVGDVFVTDAGNYGLSVAAPILDLDGDSVGVLMGSLRLADRNPEAYSIILDPPVDDDRDVLLVSRDGLIIAHSALDMAGIPLEDLVVSSDPYLVAARQGEWGPRKTVIDGEDWYGSSAQVEATDWTVVVQYPESVLMESVWRAVAWICIVIFLAYITVVAILLKTTTRHSAKLA